MQESYSFEKNEEPCFFLFLFLPSFLFSCSFDSIGTQSAIQCIKENIHFFQKTSLFQRWFSNLTMKMLAKATAIFVPMAVPWVCRELLPHNWKEFSVNIKKISISLKIFVHVAYGGYALFVWCVGV